MSVRFAVVLAVGVAAGGALAGTASAHGSGVFVDPGSPAGKEYGVPLSDLRGTASGHVPVGDETPPLFGIGISPTSGGAGPTPRAQGGLRRDRPARVATRRRAGAVPPSAGGGASGIGPTGASPVDGAVLAGLTHHGSPVPAVTLFAGLILLGGLAVGAGLVAARRRLH